MQTSSEDGKFKFQIVTPEAIQMLSREDRVTLPALEGLMTILPGHTQLTVQLKPGVVRIFKDDHYSPSQAQSIFINGGFASIAQDECTIMTEGSQPVSKLNIKQLEQQKTAIEEKLKDKLSSSEEEYYEENLALINTKIEIAIKEGAEAPSNLD